MVDLRSSAPDVSPRIAALLLFLIVLAVVGLRLHWLQVPLERDEGEYAYFGQLILQGGLPYRDAYNMKPPGIYYAHALALWLCGETAQGVRLAVTGVSVASALLFYGVVRHWLTRTSSLLATATFALLAAHHRLLGFASKAEHFVLLFALAGLAAGLGSLRRQSAARMLGAGIACGLAMMMKPTAVVFPAYLAWHAATQHGRSDHGGLIRTLSALTAGCVLPVALAWGWFWSQGAIEPMWFWTVTYAREYASAVPIRDGLRLAGSTMMHVFGGAPAVWALAVLGWWRLWRANTRTRSGMWSFLLAGAGAVALGWRFSEHYFLLLVPQAALGVGLCESCAGKQFRRWSVAFAAMVIAGSGVQEWVRFHGMSPSEVSRTIYGRNPFPEAIDIAKYIQAATTPWERVAVIGSEPEIYFYARRRAATGFVYTYPLMESHLFALAMQEQMIREIERAQPRFLVLVHVPTSWSRQANSHVRILDWSAAYANSLYRPCGLVEIPEHGFGRSVWGQAALYAQPQSDMFISVFERIS
ncbi:MAG: hypothetical protein KatS3mg077_0831 [Candidatus Binatia bacterium]|nr:MAG: hypothetical protein KatS3mg077_0831 [Candidatus Binatia bacterium]